MPYPLAAVRGKHFGQPLSIRTLPQNLDISSGALEEGFETVGDWSGTGGTLVADTTYYKSGSQSLKQTSSNQTPSIRDKTVSCDLSSGTKLAFWIYIHDVVSNIQGMQLYLSSDPWSKYFNFALDKTLLAQGWNYIVVLKSDFNNAGGESWSNTMTTLRIRVTASAGNDLSVSWDDFRSGPQFQPAIMFSFDDGNSSIYTDAYPDMNAHNVRAVVYIISDLIDDANYITNPQLITLDAAGWDICNHSKTHPNFTTLTQAQIETEISGCNTALDGWAVGDAKLHLAYPYGARDADSDAAMAAQSMLSGRLAGTGRQFWMQALFNWYHLPIVEILDNGLSLAAAKALVDDIDTNQSVGLLLGHRLEAAADAGAWAIADFQELIDYIIAADIPIVTMSDLWALKTAAVTIPLATS